MFRMLLSAAVAVALVASLEAHHSIAGVYDSRTVVTFEATVVEFQFVSPHPFVVVARASGEDTGQQWRLEMDNRFELSGIGMTATTLRKGDRVTVTGSAARDGSRGLYVRRLERPADGFWYEQAGSSPRSSLSRRR